MRRLREATRILAALIPHQGPKLATRVATCSKQAWQVFETAWLGEIHRRNIARRDEIDPDFYCQEDMLLDGPFTAPAWAKLEKAGEAMVTALPDEAAAWVRLGAALAAVFDPRSAGQDGRENIVNLQNQLSMMAPQPLLDGLCFDLSTATLEQVDQLHKALWARLAYATNSSLSDPSENKGLCDQEAQEQNGRHADGRKKRMTPEQANAEAMKLARKLRAGFFAISERQQANKIGCSWATWKKTPFYKEAQARRTTSKPKKPPSPKTESLTARREAVTGVGGRDEVLEGLIAEQVADMEPSPLERDPEVRPRKVHSRKRL